MGYLCSIISASPSLLSIDDHVITSEVKKVRQEGGVVVVLKDFATRKTFKDEFVIQV
jgi:hypothetical protein